MRACISLLLPTYVRHLTRYSLVVTVDVDIACASFLPCCYSLVKQREKKKICSYILPAPSLALFSLAQQKLLQGRLYAVTSDHCAIV